MEPAGPRRMPIGMFSRASLLSVKQLRRYHENGILVPAFVDPLTGYRMYDASQVYDAAVLTRLRALDLPMADVARVLAARDPEVTREVLAEHDRVLRARRDELEAAIVALQQALGAPAGHTPTHLRAFAGGHTLQITGRVAPDAFGDFMGPAFDELERFAATNGVTVDEPGWATYPAEVTDVEEVAAILMIGSDDAARIGPGEGRVRRGRLEPALCAVAVHAGSFTTMADTYGPLGIWVATHAESAGLPVLERYVVAPGEVSDPDELRTEIWWPIRAGRPR
ncbi:GyrI-like domain-containing protein [Tsukamurella sp. 8F]|uniref:MerR family transcriptional regulator n=1 Tax=unclassified Tsukamurella TaxID=2633480 RepID=UPI0023B94858|nr:MULTISPECIES: GyrI-like domain-containing protein [unclassified Tsukamurella]MDF0530094.1 GyrI-like domain-containing protein [Tsukamurella sp. 8J]MDF0586412.1 GyrI-like domain-containing protein [Tsukamurella sp. 8F]